MDIENLANGFFMNISIIPINLQKESQIFFIKHPRTNLASPFLVLNDKIYELLEVDRFNSSFFFAKQVISNGNIFLAVEFHPLFLALPLIIDRQAELYSLEGYFDNTDLKQIELLIKPYFYLVCQQTEISGYTVWSYSEKKMLDWLCSRILKLILYLRETKLSMELTIIKDDDLVELALDIIRHYIRASLAQILKNELRKRYPGSFQSLYFLSSGQSQHMQVKTKETLKGSEDYEHASNPIVHSEGTSINNNQIKQSNKPLKKDAQAKKKKKDIVIPKYSIESFFSPIKS